MKPYGLANIRGVPRDVAMGPAERRRLRKVARRALRVDVAEYGEWFSDFMEDIQTAELIEDELWASELAAEREADARGNQWDATVANLAYEPTRGRMLP